jgi:hypothetical protein
MLMHLQPYQGSVNYPTYVARQWIKSGECAADNWSALIHAFDNHSLGIGELRGLLEKVLAPVLNRRSSPLASKLIHWALNKIHWREILEDVRRSLSSIVGAGSQNGRSNGKGLPADKQDWSEQQYYQHLPSSSCYSNEPTAIVANWLASNNRAASKLDSISSLEQRSDSIADIVSKELSRAQARSRLAAQLLNWALTLVDKDEIAQLHCINPAERSS